MSLRAMREAAGLTQVQAAKRLGVNQSAVGQWETRRTFPRTARLPRIAALYGCTVEDLLAPDEGAAEPVRESGGAGVEAGETGGITDE